MYSLTNLPLNLLGCRPWRKRYHIKICRANCTYLFYCEPKSKGKCPPTTSLIRHRGSQPYSSNTFAILALEGSGWPTPRLCRFTPCEDPLPILHEAGRAAAVGYWTDTENLAPLAVTGIHSPNRPACNYLMWVYFMKIATFEFTLVKVNLELDWCKRELNVKWHSCEWLET